MDLLPQEKTWHDGQRIDLEAQKNGSTFYESFEENEHTFEHPSTVKKSKQI